MRTPQRDQGRLVTFSGQVTAGSVSRGANNGVEWWVSSAGGGIATIGFDPRLTPLAVTASANGTATGWTVRVDSLGPGAFRLVLTNSANALTNDLVGFTATCLDRRY